MTALDDYLSRLEATRKRRAKTERAKVDLSIRKPRQPRQPQDNETRRIILQALHQLGTPEALRIASSVSVGLVEITEV